jgi:glycosyltransferase involved in cell wall biosynthesis
MISRPFRIFRDFQARFPGINVLAVPLRAAIFFVDTILAAIIFLVWLLSYGLFRKLIQVLRGNDRPISRTICFLSQEGFTVAPTRIRTYYFAERVANLGIRTNVLAFWDDIYRFNHLPERPIFSVERVVVSLIAAHRLLADPPAAIVQQRPNYDLITTWVLHWLLGTPVIFDIDDWIGDYIWVYPIRVRHVLPAFRSLASVCVVSSSRLEQELSPIFPHLVKIPTFADTDVFRPRLSRGASDDVVFGWNGTLFQKFMYDALLLMIRAFCLAHDRLNGTAPIVFEIAGTGYFLDKIKTIVSAEFADYPIRIKGWVDPRTMADYLDGIDVGLYSLKMAEEGPDSEEAKFILSKSPTKVFEYMAKGIPTISTRLGEVERFIQQGVTGYSSDDVDELADAFVTLATDSELRARMGAVARQQCVEHYSMATAGAMFAAVITAACDVAIPGEAKAQTC